MIAGKLGGSILIRRIRDAVIYRTAASCKWVSPDMAQTSIMAHFMYAGLAHTITAYSIITILRIVKVLDWDSPEHTLITISGKDRLGINDRSENGTMFTSRQLRP